MTFKPKIDVMQVQRLLRDGKNQSEISRELGCSKQAISKLVQRLKRQGKIAPSQVEVYGQIDGMAQWNEINRIIRGEIERLNEKIKEMDDKIDFAEITEDEKELKSLFAQRKSLQAERMQNLKEARQQIDLLKDIVSVIANVESFQRLKQRLLDVIFLEVKDLETRNRILQRIGEIIH